MYSSLFNFAYPPAVTVVSQQWWWSSYLIPWQHHIGSLLLKCCCDGSLIQNRNMNRMWAFMFLCFLGLNLSQATGEVLGPSTQMYYVRLTIESSVFQHLMDQLNFDMADSDLRVNELQRTTICEDEAAHAKCRCEPGHRWSENVCQSNSKCCGMDTCTFPQNLPRMCVSKDTVTIKGSMSIKGTRFQDCLEDSNTENFQNCNNDLSHKIKTVYSTLRGFDVLKMTKYSFGSIVADFVMKISKYTSPRDLIIKSESLIRSLGASLNLNTTGVVYLKMPDNPVKFNSKHVLGCISQEDLNTKSGWWLSKYNRVFLITNGTEAYMTSTARTSTLTLKSISAPWEGEYTCEFHHKTASLDIRHKASAVMDVALLPNIYITTVPQFPRCQNKQDNLDVRGQCLIKKDNETYTVTWTSQNVENILPLKPHNPPLLYPARVVVRCHSSLQIPKLTCTFQNRVNQMRDASVDINIIHGGDRFCGAEGDWGETKAGFTAVLLCKNTVGQRQRKCSDNSTWEQEIAECLSHDVSTVVSTAESVDIGRGSVNENAAEVFRTLGQVTNNTGAMAAGANMKASVGVFNVLSKQPSLRLSGLGVDDFLESSSNLMEQSLENSWKDNLDDRNVSLAESYMTSVEKLIEVANITGVNTKKNIEVATCNKTQGSRCTNTAFGVTVDFDSSDNDSVATAAFKQLENYLPQIDEKYEVNSIVVSTTTQKKRSSSVVVNIKFLLLRPRPRNTMITCVSWDIAAKQWSPQGCKWMGANDDGHCVCSHLSSFAILMARDPVVLPGMTEITTIGLSVSVISLVITLVIELIVWGAVVKTNTLYLRHVAQVNISLCLLIADCCFLASSKPHGISEIWCVVLVVMKHFCYLSMFFWMLCMSTTLLHQAVFLFHTVSKKTYLRYSLIMGYTCPLLIVGLTFIAHNAGAEGEYFSRETCWLVYSGHFRGSIFAFIMPIFIIVVINVFSMAVVIMKLLNHPQNTVAPHYKGAAKSVIRTIILLTPIFGATWIFGFGVTILDLTDGIIASLVNYVFVVLNSFQGFLILLTTYLGDKLTRDTVLNRLRKKSVPISDSSNTLNTTLK